MNNPIPDFNDETIAKLVMELYGIEGKISALVSYEDQNARINTLKGSYVLKIANNRLPIEGLQVQTDAFEHVRKTVPTLNLPRIIPSIKGGLITIVDGFAIRLLTFLEGDVLANANRSPALYHSIGSFMGQFSNAMKDFNRPDALRPDDLWNLDNILACKIHLKDVVRSEDRARIERCFDTYVTNTQPKLPELRKAVIHNDANEQNLLVCAQRPDKVSGLIDFGDLQFASQVNELAITLAYALLEEKDIEMAAGEVIHGYTAEFPLEVTELEMLPNLLAMRLVQSIIMSSNNAKAFPDNEYILISQKPALALLKKLENEKPMIGAHVYV